jgi:hypothetical protein
MDKWRLHNIQGWRVGGIGDPVPVPHAAFGTFEDAEEAPKDAITITIITGDLPVTEWTTTKKGSVKSAFLRHVMEGASKAFVLMPADVCRDQNAGIAEAWARDAEQIGRDLSVTINGLHGRAGKHRR